MKNLNYFLFSGALTCSSYLDIFCRAWARKANFIRGVFGVRIPPSILLGHSSANFNIQRAMHFDFPRLFG